MKDFKIYDGVELGVGVSIGEFSVIGRPTRLRYTPEGIPVKGELNNSNKTVISSGCYIGTHVLIESGARVGEGCVIESRTTIESEVILGTKCFIVHGSLIGSGANIGSECIISGLVSERTVIGNRCRVLGKLIHSQRDPAAHWDDLVEDAPTLEDNVFVGNDALIIGGVHLAHHTYVVAGAIVTKSVPSFHIAKGVNVFMPVSKWTGCLAKSNFWKL